MDPGAGPESSLTVNEQVIVMSGHETIRVLEVGVDAQIAAEDQGKGLESAATTGSQGGVPADASEPAGDAGPENPDTTAEATGMRSLPQPGIALPKTLPVVPQGASHTVSPKHPAVRLF